MCFVPGYVRNIGKLSIDDSVILNKLVLNSCHFFNSINETITTKTFSHNPCTLMFILLYCTTAVIFCIVNNIG